jgi:hypothetical protein
MGHETTLSLARAAVPLGQWAVPTIVETVGDDPPDRVVNACLDTSTGFRDAA